MHYTEVKVKTYYLSMGKIKLTVTFQKQSAKQCQKRFACPRGCGRDRKKIAPIHFRFS